ncbi:hypothetical protein [Kitasatospora sp. MBT63]|uniref:hypothetical protein n=1 Tax=Kitasatospora sp. MBT63 TaxID=1444768 RepID=UPI000539D2A1|nr:hypothetical protein [Kitasatospora sp. MBT63]
MTTDSQLQQGSYLRALTLLPTLVVRLDPAPRSVEIACTPWAPGEPEIRISTHRDLDTLTAWAAELGTEVTCETWATGARHYVARAEVGGIPVELFTLITAPRPEDGAE